MSTATLSWSYFSTFRCFVRVLMWYFNCFCLIIACGWQVLKFGKFYPSTFYLFIYFFFFWNKYWCLVILRSIRRLETDIWIVLLILKRKPGVVCGVRMTYKSLFITRGKFDLRHSISHQNGLLHDLTSLDRGAAQVISIYNSCRARIN